jgi:c-di-GMP-binding flagellar brake protein YcgR
VLIEVRKGRRSLGPNLAVHLLDLSEAGAGVFMKGELQENDEVEIRVSLSGVRSSIKRIAKVRWVTKLETGNFLMGLQFAKQIPSADVASFVRPS